MEWRTVPGFSRYECSSEGQIRCAGQALAQYANKNTQYLYVRIADDSGKMRLMLAHRLICMVFHGPPPTPDHEVAHYDGVRQHNAETNLRWATITENRADSARHGTLRNGERINTARLTEDQVREIRRAHNAMPRKQPGKNIGLAKQYGVSLYCIEDIVYGRNWRHLLTAQE